MRYSDIRKILEKYTSECRECPNYESCNAGCNTFLARLIKEEITELMDKELIL